MTKSDALACPRETAEPLSAEVHKLFETLEFRKPYRICGVQSFGEKWAFRRLTGPGLSIWSPELNEKSLLLLGLTANKCPRRIHSFGQAGGGKGIRTHDTAVVFWPIEQQYCSESTGFRA
jgi:hypothetical protein